jgi:hypothetical protein
MDRRMSPKTINLALQGGGSHGAYTWGALDAFAEDTRIEISAIFQREPAGGTESHRLRRAPDPLGLAQQ